MYPNIIRGVQTMYFAVNQPIENIPALHFPIAIEAG
jgi:hypothetical protein